MQRARQGCGSAGASPSRCRLLPESQRHWARGGGLRGWGDGGFVRLGRVSGRDEPAHQPRSGNAASTTLAPLSRAPTRTVSGARLRAGLTGRNAYLAGFPGFHPGLLELALQAGIARRADGIDIMRRILT